MADDDNGSEEIKTQKSRRVYARGTFSKSIKEYLKANGDENCTDETIELIEQLMIEFILELTYKIRLDEPTKQIKPEDVLIHLIRERKKFDRGAYILYQGIKCDRIKNNSKQNDSTKMLKNMDFFGM
ncbi:hypothetical protein EIN_155710 [Entamoeba invadens IP1]|uniref:Uncharacterized protein n=1 Tax=Entamoeba invadens IP1 TaxID=370355 RepID=A0A0A1U971_ENTIV|nr:hypothetical protein EIN_155710 [Entamoeba invadens IP1]ELP91454.1 hypothetical protein EIN_155710 [Entamoeba invadens IP1]|eukprot:XP_004258225.1 hypothetical protein EIN_155710 [Entamoeba invadens IP1]